jgi:hypothetical protein
MANGVVEGSVCPADITQHCFGRQQLPMQPESIAALGSLQPLSASGAAAKASPNESAITIDFNSPISNKTTLTNSQQHTRQSLPKNVRISF